MITLHKELTKFRDAGAARRSVGEREKGFAMLSAILFMILMAGLSVALLSTILSATAPVYLAQKSTRSIYVAQAGVQAALAKIRSAAAAPNYAGQVFGNPAILPCTFTGNVDGVADSATYTVTVAYYASDPSAGGVTPLTCGASMAAPSFAVITAKGTTPASPGGTSIVGNRTLVATYQFLATNLNVPGGRIYDGSGNFCLDAVTPTAGSYVGFVPKASCTNDTDELWIYNSTWQLQLASTKASNVPVGGLCVTGPTTIPAPGAITATNTAPSQNVVLKQCDSTATGWNQLWSWTGSYSWNGQMTTIANGPSAECLSGPSTIVNGSYLLVLPACSGTFTPTSAVGAGAAGYSTHQIVNHNEFGRCADVTNEDIGHAFMISYPCKQDPTGTGTYLKWNHKWYYTEPASYPTALIPNPPANAAASLTQNIYVYDSNGNKNCLTDSSSNTFPFFSSCLGTPLTPDQSQSWTRNWLISTNNSLSYTFVDGWGRCLVADPNYPFNSAYSELDVQVCNGSNDSQRWNAPVNSVDSNINGFKEVAP